MKLLRAATVVTLALCVGGLTFWAVGGDESRQFDHLSERAFCVLDLPEGVPSIRSEFTTTRTSEHFHVGVRSRRRDEKRSFSISRRDGLICRVTTDSCQFSCGRDIPPGTYEITLSQERGCFGALVVLADEKPIYLTGWQIWSRGYVVLLAIAGVWALAARNFNNSRNRALSFHVFEMLLLGFVAIFSYLLFHEGGHALGEICFGRFDLASSDFWGIFGTPHSGGKSGPSLEPWQQAVISGGGPLLPTLAGWALFVLWNSGFGRRVRSDRPVVNLYFSTVVAILVFPLITFAGFLLGIISGDGDWRGFITNVPGPMWLVEGILWGGLVGNAFLLWRVVPELWRALMALALALPKFAPPLDNCRKRE